MKYSPDYFKNTMPDWKRKKDPLIARAFHRPISFAFSSLFTQLNMTPNQVSFISLLLAFITCALFASGRTSVLILAFVLLNLWSITDSADGNMARAFGGKPYGDFIDATSSYFLFGMMFLSLGISVYQSGGIFSPVGMPEMIVLGALAGSLDTMTRLFFQKMKNNAYEIRFEEISKGIHNTEDITDRSSSTVGRIQAKVDGEFTCGGSVHLLLLLACILTHAIDLYIVIYFLYSSLTFIASVYYLVRKTKCLK